MRKIILFFPLVGRLKKIVSRYNILCEWYFLLEQRVKYLKIVTVIIFMLQKFGFLGDVVVREEINSFENNFAL